METFALYSLVLGGLAMLFCVVAAVIEYRRAAMVALLRRRLKGN